jgi:hypothetical protein
MTPNLEMNIYSAVTGVQMTIKWASEKEYQLGKKFLIDQGAVFAGSSDGKMPEFFGLETKQQLDALLEFRRSLREQKKT